MAMGDTETGEFREHPPGEEGVSGEGSDLDDRDELRVQRTEEELAAGTREVEAGAMRVRKRVRTEREQVRSRPAARRSRWRGCRFPGRRR